jgi:hypothetical protein
MNIRPKPFLASRLAIPSTGWSGSSATIDPTSAIAREKQIKKWRRDWKIGLIEEANPDWLDRYELIVR